MVGTVGAVDGRRLRTWLVVAPMVTLLALLLGFGVLAPQVLDPGPGLGVYRTILGLTGALATLAVAVAAVRTRGRLRASWTAITATAALWTVSLLVALGGGPESLAWGAVRPAACVTGAIAFLLAPGVRRTARAWGLVVLDGWLVAGSVFLIGWLALYHTGSRGAGVPPDRATLLWIPVDLVFVSVVAGLAMRADRATRMPVLMMVLVSLLTVTADCTYALALAPHFAALQWIIMMLAFAASTVSPQLDLWREATVEPRPRLVRWPQVAVVPGLAAAVSSPTRPMVAIVAVSVIVAMVVEILLVSRQNAELWQALQNQAVRLDLLVRESRDAIVQVGRDGCVELANDAVTDVLGCAPQDLVGRPFTERLHPEDRAPFLAQIARLADDDHGAVRVHSRFRHPDGTLRHVEATVGRRLPTTDADRPAGYTLLARDVTDRIRREGELRQLASSDGLTGLLNRQAFLDVVDERLAAGAAAVLFLDLDGFKAVNDLNGHAAGDRLLVEAAHALRGTLDVDDVAARLGGDEFAVLTGSPDAARACRLAHRITDRLGRLPSDSAGRTSVSVGVAADRGTTAEQLLADADVAMYRAKAEGGGRHALFEPRMRAPGRVGAQRVQFTRTGSG
jgi:diguanylate cyclase (GGDEF)-like protein/PAS domain S-box-containing protein